MPQTNNKTFSVSVTARIKDTDRPQRAEQGVLFLTTCDKCKSQHFLNIRGSCLSWRVYICTGIFRNLIISQHQLVMNKAGMMLSKM